jgi:hypothetical protein
MLANKLFIFKSQNYGYGIAISGGLCSTNQDSSIYISDIVPGGPAQNKLLLIFYSILDYTN